MGIAKKIKMVLLDKGMTQKALAEKLGYTTRYTLYNMMSKDNLTYATAEKWADALDCDIVLRDRATGKIYD